jgi:regulation of enolase protein 1 (concanavalin A-like superfamily)
MLMCYHFESADWYKQHVTQYLDDNFASMDRVLSLIQKTAAIRDIQVGILCSSPQRSSMSARPCPLPDPTDTDAAIPATI